MKPSILLFNTTSQAAVGDKLVFETNSRFYGEFMFEELVLDELQFKSDIKAQKYLMAEPSSNFCHIVGCSIDIDILCHSWSDHLLFLA